MKLKSLILLAVLMIGGGCLCDCEDQPNYYNVTGINAVANVLAERFGNQTEREYKLENNEKVDYNKLIIQLIPTKTYYGKKSETIGFSFVNSAYACKCGELSPGEMGSTERLSEIKIYSDAAFTSGGSSSELLNQYFEIAGMTYETYREFFDLNSVLINKPVLSTFEVKLRLKTKPTGIMNHKFTIQYKLTNGESYTATTQEVMFN